ncbi:hypothetical protein MNBD_ACTINO01-1107 [hydrothermal vent metagenome]|uniref:Uncharacterized protein n=1 Tax=hydrothermal vent metagenome TaxID=652676 RepID=A0A3B0S1V2_9ZZZZ
MISCSMAGVDLAMEYMPTERKRVVDTRRVFVLTVVVLGHWLATSIWIQPDGTVAWMTLGAYPGGWDRSVTD